MDGQDGGRKSRLSAGRKKELVLLLLKGADAAELSRKHGVSQAELFRWRDRFLVAGQEVLKARRNGWVGGHEREIRRLQRKVGELTLEAADALDEAVMTRYGSRDEIPEDLRLRSDNGSIFLARHYLDMYCTRFPGHNAHLRMPPSAAAA